MTYIEFYSPDPLNNVCSCLTKEPDKVIFIGSSKYEIRGFIGRCRELFGDRVAFEYRKVNLFSLSAVVEALSDIVENEPDCSFDLTGGPDLALVAMGIVAERYRDRNIQMHRINIEDGRVTDCDEDGKTLVPEANVSLTAEQLIRLHGGSIAEDMTSAAWELDEDLLQAAEFFWNQVTPVPVLWNTRVTLLAGIDSACDPAQSTERIMVTPHAVLPQKERDELARNADCVAGLLEAMQEEGIVTRYSLREPAVTIEYRDRQVRRVMAKAGNILELKTYIAAKTAKDTNGKPVYTDCVSGAVIDWAGNDLSAGTDPINEIDLILMRGMQPVFISCKNGDFTAEELFRFKTVTEKFGGKFAKMALVATYPVNNADLRFRARELGIILVDGVMYMKEHSFTSRIAVLYEQ